MIYTVPLELGGKELTLEFNSKAYMAMHELTGIDLVMGGWKAEDLGTKEINCLLFAGAITHHPDLEFDWCLANIRARDMKRILKALFDAYDRSMPEPEPGEKENPPKPVT
jgi:hypothetical protein